MFSLRQSADLLLQIPSTSFQHHDLLDDLLDDLLLDSPLLDGISSNNNILSSTTNSKRKRTNKLSPGDDEGDRNIRNTDDDGPHENKKKRMMHRDIERVRRQEMSKLYASLRSLLPVEFIKGKRSISDHMHQAVNYIKHMQENIKCLSVNRDGLKKLSEQSTVLHNHNPNRGTVEITSSLDRPPNTVTVASCHGGVEIMIKTNLVDNGHFTLSRVLKVLSQEGLSVISCTSTKVNERFLHSIQSEVSDLTSIHVSELQQKLSDVVNTHINLRVVPSLLK